LLSVAPVHVSLRRHNVNATTSAFSKAPECRE
jgi:hypothetical protein